MTFVSFCSYSITCVVVVVVCSDMHHQVQYVVGLALCSLGR